MPEQLHWETVSDALRTGLEELMGAQVLQPFRLVGGTALSLQLGHRTSIDIDLFSDAPYGSLDFLQIHEFLQSTFEYVQTVGKPTDAGLGMPYIVGPNEYESFKLDIYYSDETFIQEFLLIDRIRLATIEEIAAMKMEVIQRKGRKKDFWDIHELMAHQPIESMMELHAQRYPYTHDTVHLRSQLTNFLSADGDPDPACVRGKHWELIKLDFLEWANQ